jgi:hypothetical protein
MKISIMKLSIMKLSIMKLSIMKLSIMKLSIMKLVIMKLSKLIKQYFLINYRLHVLCFISLSLSLRALSI